MNSAALYQSGRSSDRRGSVACQASIAVAPARRLARARGRRGRRPARRSGPSPACSASTSAGRPRTRRPGGPRRARTGATAARPGPARRSPRRRPRAARRRRSGAGRRVGSSRPSVGEVGPQLAVGDRHRTRSRTVTVTPGARDAARANVPRRPDGAPTGAWRIAPSTSGDATVSCQAPASAGWRGSAAGSCPGEHEPDRQRVRARVLDPPLEDPDRQGARLEVAGDDRAELLADEADAERARLERLPRPREQRVVRAAALGQRPAPVGQRRPVAASTGPSPCRRRPGRPTKSEKPSAATGSNRCRPTSRCQRAKSPRCVRPMLPVPRPPIGTPAHAPSSIIGRSTRGWPTSGQGRPIGRAPGDRRDVRPADALDGSSAPSLARPRSRPRRA